MEDRFNARPYWLLIAAACLVPALLSALTTYVNSNLRGTGANWHDMAFASGDWIFFGGLTPIPYVLARRFPLRRETIGSTLLAHSMGALLLCFIWALLGVVLGISLNHYPQGDLSRIYLSWMLTTLPWSMFLYLLVLGCVFAVSYYRESRERESQQVRLSAQLAEARLSALRMQLHPHFLFNSLNAITVLLWDQKTTDAARMLELLSDVLRQVLRGERREEVTLEEELRFIRQYLEIEQVRFSDRLQVRWSIDNAIRDARVPSFILQPLVENAVRHGIAKLSDSGEIEISAQGSEGEVILSIRDNGPGFRPIAGAGVGLANTSARLNTLFGDAAKLEVGDARIGETIATLRFPLRRQADG